jgi:hypothetical protein
MVRHSFFFRSRHKNLLYDVPEGVATLTWSRPTGMLREGRMMSRPDPAVARSLPLPFFPPGSLLCSLTMYVISTFPQHKDPGSVHTRTQVSHSFPLICSNTRAEPVDGSPFAIVVVSNLTGTPSKLAATICTWTVTVSVSST